MCYKFVLNKNIKFIVFVGIGILLFEGCKYSEVASYSNKDGSILVRVLDPTECDFARYLKFSVEAFKQMSGPFELELLDCNKSFNKSEYEIFEDTDSKWFFFLERETPKATSLATIR